MRIIRPEGLLDAASLELCLRILKQGGIVCYPTETYYALGIDPWNVKGREKLYAAKGRNTQKELSCIAANLTMVAHCCDTSDPRLSLLAARYWPGPLTMVLPLLSSDATLAVRVSSHPIALQLAEALGGPIVSTSANLSGEPAVADPVQLPERVKERIDVLVDAGLTAGGAPSTIVSLLGRTRILREGAIGSGEILETAKAR